MGFSSNYTPYGTALEQYGTLESSLGFTGEMTDPSGLQYLRARYANPNLGMFLTRDPVEGVMDRVMSRNGYSYVEGNPVNYTDPSGKFLNFFIGAAIGAVVGAATSYAYANSLYNLATSGNCGCDIKQQIEKIGHGQFVGDAVINGVVVGAVTGVIASIAPLVAIVGGGGLGALTSADAIRKGVGKGNACNDLQYLAGLLGIVAAGVGVGGAPGFQVVPCGTLAAVSAISIEGAAAASAVGTSAAVLMSQGPPDDWTDWQEPYTFLEILREMCITLPQIKTNGQIFFVVYSSGQASVLIPFGTKFV
ncbi:MAG: RHS repeat-associated core domain-containing protein [Chloroflexi bacterium]|nr:RHS repeat-associated core domain-containing protein [Chloroflexota bacterium]MCC6892908.1 RHS repeat-associated core domain-containing protein [Anaerolineae bacterium]